MPRPLKMDGTSGFIEMSDTDISALAYYIRKAYADHIINSAGNIGRIILGTNTIGSAVDTVNAQQYLTRGRSYTPGNTADDYPNPAAAIQSSTTTYNFDYVQPTALTLPTGNVYDFSWLTIDGTDGVISCDSTDPDGFIDSVLDQAIAGLKTGDGVGSLYIGSAPPTDGSYTLLQSGIFKDTTYSDGDTTYNLYVKTDIDNPPAYVAPVYWNNTDGSIVVHDSPSNLVGTLDTHPLFVNVLGPLGIARLRTGAQALTYSIQANATGTRGTFTDTTQATATRDRWFDASTYHDRITPSGTKTTLTTYSLHIS